MSGVGRRFGLQVNAGIADRAGLLTAGHIRSVIDVPEGIGSVHIQPGQIAIVQKGDLRRRRRNDLANNGMWHSESD